VISIEQRGIPIRGVDRAREQPEREDTLRDNDKQEKRRQRGAARVHVPRPVAMTHAVLIMILMSSQSDQFSM
jgi:serine/threonine-protein kinase RIO1